MTIRALLLCIALLLAVATPSAAAVRTASSSDPVGDGAGSPSQDIVSARATYDTAGELTLSATMNGPIESAAGTSWVFDVARRTSAPFGCSIGPGYTLVAGIFPEGDATGFLMGYDDPFDVEAQVSGDTLTATWRSIALANRPYGCVTFTVGEVRGEETYFIFDELRPPIVFAGFGDSATRTGTGPLPAACRKKLGGDRALCVKRRLALRRCRKIRNDRRQRRCERRARRLQL